jgi:CheY-specific phosphatase CheX
LDSSTLKAHLIAAVDETLDKMAFMAFSPVATADVSASPVAFTVQIGFAGNGTGTLTVCFTEKTAQAISRNLLGLRNQDELYPGTLEDALKEFANIVMGRTLTLVDAKRASKLEIPTFQTGEAAAPAPGTAAVDIRGMFDDLEPCRITVHLSAG